MGAYKPRHPLCCGEVPNRDILQKLPGIQYAPHNCVIAALIRGSDEANHRSEHDQTRALVKQGGVLAHRFARLLTVIVAPGLYVSQWDSLWLVLRQTISVFRMHAAASCPERTEGC